MKIDLWKLIFCLVLSNALYAINPSDIAKALPQSVIDPDFIQGELTAIIHREYSEPNVGISVDHLGCVTLTNLPTNLRLRDSIITFVKEYRNVTKVIINEQSNFNKKDAINFVGLPNTTLFSPLLANPFERELEWGFFLYEKKSPVSKQNVTTNFSLGLYNGLMRWYNVFNTRNALELEFFAANTGNLRVSIPTLLKETSYKFALFSSYSTKWVGYRFQIWHYCAHLGDQYAIDLYKAGQIPAKLNLNNLELVVSVFNTSKGRIYFGGGIPFSHRPGTYFIYGGEFFFWAFHPKNDIFFYQPFLAIDFQNWDQFNYQLSTTVKTGLLIGRLPQASKQVRIAFTYHNGLGFGRYLFQRNEYLTFGIGWGY